MFKLQDLIRKNMARFVNSSIYVFFTGIDRKVIKLLLFQDKLALSITTEQGKTLKDAQGDVFRGLGWYIFYLLFSNIFCWRLSSSISWYTIMKRWWNMHVGWQLCRWESMFPMCHMELIPTASGNLSVFVLGFVPSTFQQWFPCGLVFDSHILSNAFRFCFHSRLAFNFP